MTDHKTQAAELIDAVLAGKSGKELAAKLVELKVVAAIAPKKLDEAAEQTMQSARAELAGMGMTIRKTDGEYRVTFKDMPRDEAEDAAYYTDYMDDAMSTAKSMHASRSKKKSAT